MCSSSAYFDSAEDSLDAAQERKLELICRKLHLAPGERLLDVLPRLSTLVCAFERSGLEVRRIESLREHYQRTVRGWHSNLAARRDEALAEIGAERVRTWQLYLLGSAFAFAFADITVFQVFCGRPAGGEA